MIEIGGSVMCIDDISEDFDPPLLYGCTSALTKQQPMKKVCHKNIILNTDIVILWGQDINTMTKIRLLENTHIAHTAQTAHISLKNTHSREIQDIYRYLEQEKDHKCYIKLFYSSINCFIHL